MPDQLPLLVFPQARRVVPETGRGFPSAQPHLPGRVRQIERLSGQLDALSTGFAQLSGAVAGLEPETVLVLEIAGHVDDFKQAVEAAGLEWLGEWDVDEIEPTDDFYVLDKNGQRTVKPLTGRMFLSASNEAGLRQLLSLWTVWNQEGVLPQGQTKWRDVFNQLRVIRRWGVEETLRETGMIERWRELLDPLQRDQRVTFQIELFYRQSAEKRRQNEASISQLLARLGGRTLGVGIDLPQIAFHAVKAELPSEAIRSLLVQVEHGAAQNDVSLFNFSGVMYFRPTGQTLVGADGDEGQAGTIVPVDAVLPPVAAILDGAPLWNHDALVNNLVGEDIFGVESSYQPGERKHGTSMASLVVHGDLSQGQRVSLKRKVWCVPVMQPNPHDRNRAEHIPDDVFFEDRIHIAVRRLLVGTDSIEAQAPHVKIINLSIGDPDRPFIHTPSPCARLLDWLSYEYRVLFCVSAGNVGAPIDIGISHADFTALTADDQIAQVTKVVSQSLSTRRLLSPAESLNALTVGALHVDESGSYSQYLPRTDLMSSNVMPSPTSRVGYGFRKSVKPEVLFAGGRQLYKTPTSTTSSIFEIHDAKVAPGQKVAYDSSQPGALSNVVHTRGSSNATALATRSAIRIHEMLDALQSASLVSIPDACVAVLIKALLVHGARQSNEAKTHFSQALKTPANSRRWKEVVSRYVGYGAPDIERVLACTNQRVTVLGCDEIGENEIHEYAFPLPIGLAGERRWRRLVVSLAWFSPINPAHRNLREAKLSFESAGTSWDKTELKVARQDADHNQVERGTVQHEIFEGNSPIASFQDGQNLRIRVICKKDATSRLDQRIPYGLAVTLEVKEDVPISIYQQVQIRLRPQVQVGVRGV